MLLYYQQITSTRVESSLDFSIPRNQRTKTFVAYDNQLRLENQGERRVSKNKGETLNHVIIQVKSSGSGWSNDVITTRFLIFIKGKENCQLPIINH